MLFSSKAKKTEILNLVKEMNFEILNLRMFFYTEKRECKKCHKNSFLLTRLYVFPIFHFQNITLINMVIFYIKLHLKILNYVYLLKQGVERGCFV
jgi:hypothetical protein